MTMTSKAEDRLVIDNKIAHLLECIGELKSERNNLAPISILPPEILSTIFDFALDGQIETSRFFPCYYFTHVSRSWRSVALATPNLWQHLPQNIDLANVVLERLKGGDLIVQEELYPKHSRIMFLEGVLANHTSRIRELALPDIDIHTLTTLFRDLPRSSLRLRCLEFSYPRMFQTAYPTLPIGIFDTAILQTLNLNSCITGHWYSLSFPALTTLMLHNIVDRPPLFRFLEFLQSVPTLRILVMENSLPLANDLVGQVGFAHLPNLHRLSLSSTGNPMEVANVLRFIIVPPMALLRFAARLKTKTACHELVSSFPTFFSHLQQNTESLYSHLDVKACTGSLEVLVNARKDKTIGPDLVLKLDTLLLPFGSKKLLRWIIPSIPFLNITNLTLSGSSLCMGPFGRLPHIRHISVYGECTIQLIRALSCKPGNSNTKPVLFPALKSLWIKQLQWQEKSSIQTTLEDLQRRLTERHERMVGLSKLKLDCNLQAEQVERLQKVVNKVKWDLWHKFSGDSSDEDDE